MMDIPCSSALLQAALAFATTWVLSKLLHYLGLIGKKPSNSLDNVPGPAPRSFWKGNFDQLFASDSWEFHRHIAATYGSVSRVHGPLGTQQLFVFDPKALHQIVVKDQHIYEEPLQFIESNAATFGKGVLSCLGDQHRKQRKMLTPVFSIAHLRGVVPKFYRVAFQLRNTLLKKVAEGPQELEISTWFTRTALEIIGQSGLGHSFDQLTEDGHQHPFSQSAYMFGATVEKMMFSRQYIFPLVYNVGSPRFRRWVVDILPWKALHDLRDISDTMYNTSSELFEAKKKAMLRDSAFRGDNEKGKDLISVLMEANMNASEEDRLTDDEVIGQMSTLTFAATDTTSSALSRTMWLLANHPEIEEKLYQEIRAAREEHGDLDYDRLSALPYLDAVCRETLRLWPPLASLLRETRQDSVLPLSKPVRGIDGTEIHNILIPKDTKVMISILSSNRNPDLWGPDATEWKPERWLSPLPQTLSDARIPGVYSHLMTFIGGGRACVGFKFAQLEMKVVLSVLLEQMKFSLPEGKEIFWKMPGIAKPTVVGSEGHMLPQLPLIVTRRV